MKEILVENIFKSYGNVAALESINFDVEQGELFGLIGPDGAGKTTLFRILTSLLIPDEGAAHVADLHTVNDYKSLRRIIGYMPGKFSLYQDLTVEENLRFFATIFGTSIRKNYHLIENIYVHLEPFKKRRAGNLSGGMKQKLALCCALIHQPRVLFLDEPTTGVDAVSRSEFWEMLQRLNEKEITILVSTPYMDEARLCERIALMQDGRIMQIDTPSNVTTSYKHPLFAAKSRDFYRLIDDLRKAPFAESVQPFGEFLHVSTHSPARTEDLKDYIHSLHHEEIEVHRIEATIEDVFLDLMKAR